MDFFLNEEDFFLKMNAEAVHFLPKFNREDFPPISYKGRERNFDFLPKIKSEKTPSINSHGIGKEFSPKPNRIRE